MCSSLCVNPVHTTPEWVSDRWVGQVERLTKIFFPVRIYSSLTALLLQNLNHVLEQWAFGKPQQHKLVVTLVAVLEAKNDEKNYFNDGWTLACMYVWRRRTDRKEWILRRATAAESYNVLPLLCMPDTHSMSAEPACSCPCALCMMLMLIIIILWPTEQIP